MAANDSKHWQTQMKLFGVCYIILRLIIAPYFCTGSIYGSEQLVFF